MPNCSYPHVHAAKDTKVMDQVTAFLAENPKATYEDVTSEIAWYFDDSSFSPWIVNWILYLME